MRQVDVACCLLPQLILVIHKESVWVTPLCIYFLSCDKLFAAIEIQMKRTAKLKSEKQQTTDSFNCFVLFCSARFLVRVSFFLFLFSLFSFCVALFRVFCCVCFVPCVLLRMLCSVCFVAYALFRVFCCVCFVPCVLLRMLCSVCFVAYALFRVFCCVCFVPCVLLRMLCSACFFRVFSSAFVSFRLTYSFRMFPSG